MSQERYALYLGCTIPAKDFSYEVSLRKVFEELGIGLEDMEGYICCGYPSETPIAHDTWLAMSAYNIALAEEMGLDMAIPCNGCFGALKKANTVLKEDKKARDHINGILKETGKEFKGTVEVRHIIEILNDHREEIEKRIKAPLKEIKAGAHLGCHVLRPSEIMGFDDPKNPRIYDEMIGLTGAESMDYPAKGKCCGNVLRGINEGLSLQLARRKVADLKDSGADCMITICPACHVQYDLGQLEMKSKLKEEFNIPVLHYPQLLGLAMGIPASELGLDLLKVKPKALLEKIGV